MPLMNPPCVNCREKHQKCDKQRPICSRCKTKGLECVPVPQKRVFCSGPPAKFRAGFSGNQTWVNSTPKNWKQPKVPPSSGISDSPVFAAESSEPTERRMSDASAPSESSDNGSDYGPDPTEHGADGPSEPLTSNEDIQPPKRPRVDNPSPSISFSPSFILTPCSAEAAGAQNSPSGHQSFYSGTDTESHAQNINAAQCSVLHSASSLPTYVPSLDAEEDPYFHAHASVQESCLLRYFIEELSPLFDHCDDQKHFQLVVPCRAQRCATLRNALFAVSARHLARRHQYTTPEGILYRGHLLPDLRSCSAVEYMLKCIPDLVRFPEVRDPTEQENMMAATVILRQYEEMEEDEIAPEDDRERVNFLLITQKIIDSIISSRLNQSLATAAYWIAIRQEVYYALTRERTLHMQFRAEDWSNASVANTLIMLVGEVTKWRWGDKSRDEWEHLDLLQQQLCARYKNDLAPILMQKPNKSKGEVFPTIWFSSDAQVTGVQHLELARMILIAESPNLTNASRAVHRKAEAQVRSIVLNLCGIALNHLRCQPALLNAVIAITLYGEYFTDQDERRALLGIVKQTKSLRAWPMNKIYQSLKSQWETADRADLWGNSLS